MEVHIDKHNDYDSAAHDDSFELALVALDDHRLCMPVPVALPRAICGARHLLLQNGPWQRPQAPPHPVVRLLVCSKFAYISMIFFVEVMNFGNFLWPSFLATRIKITHYLIS